MKLGLVLPTLAAALLLCGSAAADPPGASGWEAAPDPAPEATPEAAPTPASSTPDPAVVHATLEGGYGYRTLTTLPVNGYTFAGAFGMDVSEHWGLYLDGRYYGGQTQYGMHVDSFTVTFGVVLIVDRLRLGAGVGGMGAVVGTARGRDPISSGGGAVTLAASFDLLKLESSRALYLSARYDVASAPLRGPSASLGFRF